MRTYKGEMPPLLSNQSVIYGATSEQRIEHLYKIADKRPEEEFVIPYTASTTNLPGNLTPDKLAHMYACRSFTPLNIILEESFCDLVDKHKMTRSYNIQGKAVD